MEQQEDPITQDTLSAAQGNGYVRLQSKVRGAEDSEGDFPQFNEAVGLESTTTIHDYRLEAPLLGRKMLIAPQTLNHGEFLDVEPREPR